MLAADSLRKGMTKVGAPEKRRNDMLADRQSGAVEDGVHAVFLAMKYATLFIISATPDCVCLSDSQAMNRDDTIQISVSYSGCGCRNNRNSCGGCCRDSRGSCGDSDCYGSSHNYSN